MDTAKWKLEIQAVGDKILSSYNNFKKDSSSRKTSDYKNKKLSELKTNWELFNKLDEKLTDVLDQMDAGYLAQKATVESTYAKLFDALMLLPEGDSNHEQRNEKQQDQQKDRRSSVYDDDDDDLITKGINSQKIRFTKIQESIEQVNAKLGCDAPMSKVFLNMKIKTLSAYWERISIAHEDLGSFGFPLPNDYMTKLYEIEEEHESMVLLLQEEVIFEDKYTWEIPREM